MDEIINKICSTLDQSGKMEHTEAVVAEVAKTFEERKEILNNVINNIKKAWETNPEVSFSTLLSLIEAGTNLTIYQLTDGDIVNLTTNMNLKGYIDINTMINSIKIDTVYNAGGALEGYKIIINGKSLREEKTLYEAMDINFKDNIESILLEICNSGIKHKVIDDDIVFEEKLSAFDAMVKVKNFLKEVLEELEG
jgi:hypothetical protein